jgi:hypothetical protein
MRFQVISRPLAVRCLFAGPSELNNMAYDWSRDEVQTARLSFYLRVLPSFLSNVPEVTFSNDVAPLMFLYPLICFSYSKCRVITR